MLLISVFNFELGEDGLLTYEFNGNSYEIDSTDPIEITGALEGDYNLSMELVADGFTGNVALKTAEGTANFITSELKEAMTSSILGKIGSIISINNLKKFKKKLDPRLYNGAILLGLDSPVIKSHGGTDFIGFANSLSVCEKIVPENAVMVGIPARSVGIADSEFKPYGITPDSDKKSDNE